VAQIQSVTARVIEVLAGFGVEAWLMTRGFIRSGPLSVLAAHAAKVKVTIGLTTVDRPMQRFLEPLAAPPRLRLRQIKELRALGIPVQVALEPLLPGLTDTRANLTGVLAAVAQAGIGQVIAGYAFLRPRIEGQLKQSLQSHGLDRLVLDAFEGGPILQSGNIAAARFLPKTRRQRGYAALMALAANFGIGVRISSLTNPDFGSAVRNRPAPLPTARSLPLFDAMMAASCQGNR
jgi:DNA repair photolyase